MLAAWQISVTKGWVDKFFFSRPSDVAVRVWIMFASGTVWPNLLTTMTEAALSFTIGVAGGVVFGFLLARNRWLAALLPISGSRTHCRAWCRRRFSSCGSGWASGQRWLWA